MVLTYLEIFFVVATVVSLVFNVIQWRDGKAAREPLSNALVGTFNEIKSRANYVHFAYGALFNQNNPHESVETLRWEYGHFLQSELNALEGMQEQVVSILVSLRPDDKAGTQAFRARDYGLTDADKEIRRINFERYKGTLQPAESNSQVPPGSNA